MVLYPWLCFHNHAYDLEILLITNCGFTLFVLVHILLAIGLQIFQICFAHGSFILNIFRLLEN